MNAATNGLRTTLGPARRASDGEKVSDSDIDRAIAAAQRPRQKLNGQSLSQYMMNWLTLYPVTTPEGSLPIVYSGVDRHGRSNFSNALDFVKDSRGRAVMIGDTPFGMSLMDTANQDAMNLASEALEEVLFEERHHSSGWRRERCDDRFVLEYGQP